MVKLSKFFHFTIDSRFHVRMQAGVEGVERSSEVKALLGFAFPSYEVKGLSDTKATLLAERKLFEQDLVFRIVTGGDHFRTDTPSQAYTLRLLLFHYTKLTSHRSREEFVNNLLRILRKAMHEASESLSNPGLLDFELDPELKHLVQPYTLLSESVSWAQARVLELKVASLGKSGPTLKVTTLAYILLQKHGALPTEYKALTKDFAKYIADSLNQKDLSASVKGVKNYFNVTDKDSNLFINTISNFRAALAWIKQEWPDIDINSIRPLPRMDESS